MAFFLQAGVAAGVQGRSGGGGLPEPAGVLVAIPALSASAPSARAASAAFFSASSASIACPAQVTSEFVPVSVTAVSSSRNRAFAARSPAASSGTGSSGTRSTSPRPAAARKQASSKPAASTSGPNYPGVSPDPRASRMRRRR